MDFDAIKTKAKWLKYNLDELSQSVRLTVRYPKAAKFMNDAVECLNGYRDINESLIEELKAYRALGSAERCAELAKAEREGRLHIAPCADGTLIEFTNEEEAARIMESIGAERHDAYIHGFTEAAYGEFGEDWFLTHQEDEKALESEDE